MKQYPFFQTRSGKIALGLFLAALLYLSRDTLLTTSILGLGRAQFLMLGLLCLAGVWFLVYNRREWKAILTDRRMALLLIFGAIFLLPMAVKRDWQMMYLSVLLCLFTAVFFSFFTSTEEVSKYFVVTMAAMGVYSVLAAYVLRLLPDNGILAVPTFTNSNNVLFYNFGLSYVSIDYVSNRNFGVFREPGVYQYFVVLALFLNNYTVRWEKNWKVWTINFILVCVMASTLAIGGYVETALFAMILFLDKKLYRNKWAWAVALTVIGAVAGLVVYAYMQQNMLWWEIYAMTVCKFAPGETSGVDRVNSILTNLNFFFHNPLFGGKLAEVLHAMENNTSSSTIMYAVFGILGGTLHVAGWAALVWKTGRKLWVKLGLLLVLFMSFNTQNLIADLFFWLLPTMALTEAVGKKVRRG